MKYSRIRFRLDDVVYIEVEMYCSLAEIFKFDFSPVTLHHHDRSYSLYDNQTPSGVIEDFGVRLGAALRGELELGGEVTSDLGMLWHWFLGDRNLEQLCIEEEVEHGRMRRFWRDRRCLLWESVRTHCATWLYSKNGEIYLEVTPTWPWHFTDEGPVGEEAREESYQEFIANYKPLLILPIPRAVVQEWYARTQDMMKILENTHKRQCSWEEMKRFRNGRIRAFRRLRRKTAG